MSITDATRQRSIDLAGEIKRAKEVLGECMEAEAAALAALERAKADSVGAKLRLDDKLAERQKLADEAARQVLAAGEDPVSVQDVFTPPGDVFNAPANGADPHPEF